MIDKTTIDSMKICICGIGALGSNLVDSLVRSNFNNITVIDYDKIEGRNLQTQIWNKQDIGKLKTEVLRIRMFQINGTKIEVINKKINSSNDVKKILNNDLIIDCFDNASARKILYTIGSNVLHIGMNIGYGEVIWNDKYIIPEDPKIPVDICDDPISRSIIMKCVGYTFDIIEQFLINNKKYNIRIFPKSIQYF